MTTPSPLLTPASLGDAVRAGRRLVMLTAYDHPSAVLADAAGVDMILVGDSAAMVVLGRESTNDVTLDEMVLFTRAVSRAASRAVVVGDLPFMSYQPSDEAAIRSAGRLIAEGGADCVKLEGGGRMIDRVRAITEAGIAVIGHLGLTPQSAPALGGFRAQARSADAALALLDDALALQAAGAIAIVLEAIPHEVATIVTERLDIPTIGIGAGAETSGQVLVWHDLLGLGLDARLPRFVRRYADLAGSTIDAITAYAADVRAGSFPAIEHTYVMPDVERKRLETALAPPVSIDAARAAAARAT